MRTPEHAKYISLLFLECSDTKHLLFPNATNGKAPTRHLKQKPENWATTNGQTTLDVGETKEAAAGSEMNNTTRSPPLLVGTFAWKKRKCVDAVVRRSSAIRHLSHLSLSITFLLLWFFFVRAVPLKGKFTQYTHRRYKASLLLLGPKILCKMAL